jgi:hypothetical protein
MKIEEINNKWISELIKNFVEKSSENILGDEYYEKAWENPLIGFSIGNDELYGFFKKDIGDFYLTPEEIYNRTFPNDYKKAEELSIISWILPQSKATKEEQRKEKNVHKDVRQRQ